MEEVGLKGKQKPEPLLANIQVMGPRLNMSLPSNRELRSLAPFRPITDQELTDPPNQPELVFDIANGQFMIDGKEFDHTRVDRTMTLKGPRSGRYPRRTATIRFTFTSILSK